MEDIIEEMGCRQVVLVSHRKELEGFADRMFKVEKAQDESNVILLSE